MRLTLKNTNEISFNNEVLVAEKARSGSSIITGVVSDNSNTILNLNTTKEQIAQIQVVASDGKFVYNQTKIIIAGSNTVNLQVQHLLPGIYTLVVYTSDGEIITRRFVK
ncbi:MAG: T9SS type A sorting domain-containing protein [Ferruginibacter sp.]